MYFSVLLVCQAYFGQWQAPDLRKLCFLRRALVTNLLPALQFMFSLKSFFYAFGSLIFEDAQSSNFKPIR